MKQKTVLILGGYGNAGLVIARLLAGQKCCRIILAGRNGHQAQQAAKELNIEFTTDCVSGMAVDAASRVSLLQAFQGVDIVLVAAATIVYTRIVAEAALEAGIDYFDIQISTPTKRQMLEAMRERIVQSGHCFITDGGYCPGIPAAMVRYAASQIPGLESAPVASAFQVNWKEHQLTSSTATEFVDELKFFDQTFFKNGAWTKGNMRDFTPVDFGAPFGLKYCMPMYLEEFHTLPELIPTLKQTGFYSAGFGGFMDYVVIPTAMGLLAAFPNQSGKVVARLMEWGMRYTTHSPYGAVLYMKAQGPGHMLSMTVAHKDAYFITAAPTVACLLQYFDGGFTKPGLWRQATLVEPVRFFEDLIRMGVQIKQEIE
jgi:saccharopine dehydrogenase-like NADP-dependent oxidoreductase